jgi:hypothetical protein
MTVTTDQTDEPAAPDDGARGTEPATPPLASDGTGDVRPRARLALMVACGFLLLAEIVLGGRFIGARAENNDLHQQLDAQLHDLDDGLRQLDATRARVDALQADEVDRQAGLDDSTRTAGVRQLEITELSGELVRVSGRAKDLQGAINNNTTIDKTQVDHLIVLNKCLAGIRVADVASAQGHTTDVVAALQGVVTVCQQALEIAAPGDNSNFPFDFADPSVIYGNNGKYYAYATNAAAGNVQVISSTDLKKWDWVGGTLTSLPGWATTGDTWAPSVLHRDSGYYMYYTARQASSKRQCVSVATSDRPDGGFVDHSTGPLVCQLSAGGSIDPSAFVASDGTAYLLWKSEGEVVGGSSQLWVRKLGDDFTSFDGDGVALAGVTKPWEGRTVEGPSMTEAGGRFYLLYSGNKWNTADYAEGYAVCDKPMGPCTKPADNILLQKHDQIAGPGGGEVFMAPGGQLFISYHAWTAPNIDYPNRRQLHVGKLNFSGGVPQVVDVS